MEENGKIVFTDKEGNDDIFYVVEQINKEGVNYLLVADSEEDDAVAFIMKDIASPEDIDATYVFVEDDDEFEEMAELFGEILEDEDLI